MFKLRTFLSSYDSDSLWPDAFKNGPKGFLALKARKSKVNKANKMWQGKEKHKKG